MAFVLKQSNSYFWPVEVQIPIDGGKFEKSTFDAEFKRLSQDRIEEIRADVIAGSTTDRVVANEVLIGWKGINDGSDDVPYSVTARDELLNMPKVAESIIMAWMESLSRSAA